MKKVLMIAIIMLLISAISMAKGSASQEKDIYLDTGGKLGYLIYMEQYYTLDNNNLTIEQSRIYFDGVINNSRITFMIIRPLDKQGNQYPENRIRALATLDNVTILNTWYSSGKDVKSKIGNSSEVTNNLNNHNQEVGNAPLVGLTTIIIILLLLIYLIRIVIKKLKSKGEHRN